jgi:hypothetical protein
MRLRLIAALLLLLMCSVASSQTVTQPVNKPVLLFQSVALTGNGADITDDVLYTVSIPNLLQTTGDVIHVVARGVAAATADAKSIRLKLIGQNACVIGFGATNTTWYLEAFIMRVGANSQNTMCLTNNATNNTINTTVSTPAGDATMTLNLTGQNATNPVLNSIQVQQMVAWYLPAAQ